MERGAKVVKEDLLPKKVLLKRVPFGTNIRKASTTPFGKMCLCMNCYNFILHIFLSFTIYNLLE